MVRYMEETKQSAMPLISLIMGILGLVFFCCCYGSFIFGSLAILFALLSRTGEPMAGQAKAGVILAIIGIILTVILWGCLFLLGYLQETIDSTGFLMTGPLFRNGGGWL